MALDSGLCDLLGINPADYNAAASMSEATDPEIAGALQSLAKKAPVKGKEMRMKAGTPLEIRLPLDGAPPPTVTWLRDGFPVESLKVRFSNFIL